MTKSRGAINPRRQWTNEEDRIIAEHYPLTSSTELSELLGCSRHVLYRRVEKLGIKKAPGFVSLFVSGCFQRGERRAPQTQFKPGNKPWSAGKKIGTRGRTGETQFKKGLVPHNYLPVGTEKLNTEGFVIVKVSDTGIQRERWKFKHRLIWEAANGPVAPDHAVVFKDRDRLNCQLDNLELVSRTEMAARFGINSMPKEIADLMKLKGAITRAINKRSQANEQ